MCLANPQRISEVDLPEVFTVYKVMRMRTSEALPPKTFSGACRGFYYKVGWNVAKTDKQLNKRNGYKLGFHAFLHRRAAYRFAFYRELIVPITIKRSWCTAYGFFNGRPCVCFKKFYMSETDIENAWVQTEP